MPSRKKEAADGARSVGGGKINTRDPNLTHFTVTILLRCRDGSTRLSVSSELGRRIGSCENGYREP